MFDIRMYKSTLPKESQNWKEATLIVPCVSVGNVAQLSADLIISTLKLNKIGIIYHNALLPVVGNDPYNSLLNTQCKLTTPCEVYENSSHDLVVIQQRSPLIKGKKEEFSTWLSEWMKEKNFKQVIVLTSSFAHERIDSQLSGSQLRILMSEPMEEEKGKFFLDTLKWIPLEKRISNEPVLGVDNDPIFFPGSGIAKQLLNKCSNQNMLVMSVFCSEGDNIHDAFTLSSYLNSWLHLIGTQASDQPAKWSVPQSWKLIYGSQFDPKLFH